VVVACVHGHEVSRTVMAALRSRGVNAVFLQGGVEAWRAQAVAGQDEKHNWKPL
jgi:superoxide dismutase, Fe-Mn family